MEYPKLIHLDEETKAELVLYLDEQLVNHEAERGAIIEDWNKIHRDYDAEPTIEVRDFPFRGASNLIIPLIAIATEVTHANNMTTAFAIDQIVSVKTIARYVDLDKAIENYLDHDLGKINFKKSAENLSLEMVKLGTAVGKSLWKKEVRKAIRFVEDKREEFEVTTFQGSTIEEVPTANFLMPFEFQDPQTAPWCGEEHRDEHKRILFMEKSGLFYEGTYKKLEAYYKSVSLSSEGLKAEEYQQKLQNMEPMWPRTKIIWYELYITYDVDKSMYPKEIVVYFHKDSRELMGVRYNWFDDLRRPYRIGQHFPVAHRWVGVGVGKMARQFQREITTQHRQRLDNATLANSRGYKVKALSSISMDEPVFPGKQWRVDDMDDIQPFQLGEIYPSSYSNEHQSLMYYQQRLGVNELSLGMPQAGTPGTAASDLSRMQELKRRVDYQYGNFHTLLTELINDYVCNISQFGFRDVRYFDYVENGAALKEFFELPVDVIRSGLVAQFSLVRQNMNKLVDRQTWTQLVGFLTTYFQQTLALIQQLGDPTLVQKATVQMIKGSSEAMKQIFESYDVRDPERILLTNVINESLSRATGSNGSQGISQAPSIPGPPQIPQIQGGISPQRINSF